MNRLTDDGTKAPSSPEYGSPAQCLPEYEYGQSIRKRPLLVCRISAVILKLAVVTCLLYILCIWSLEPEIKPRGNHTYHSADRFSFLEWLDRSTKDEQRIARHFEMDTLPGLMQRGLVRKYERRDEGTVLLVEGNIWRQRSRFFRESLLVEVLVYNKVNGFASSTQVVDYSSRRLYARAVAADRKEFFD